MWKQPILLDVLSSRKRIRCSGRGSEVRNKGEVPELKQVIDRDFGIDMNDRVRMP